MRQLLPALLAVTLCLFSAGAAAPDEACALAQQSACCKANKGICGCRAGKIVCCDKTFADDCPCNREDEPLTSS